MPDFPSFSSLFRIGRDEILARRAKLSREAVEREGADSNVLVAAGAAMADEVVGQLVDLEAALFLASAVGEDLDRWVFDRYGLTRKPAAASIGSVEFSTIVPSPVTFTIPTGVVLQTSEGLQFITTESGVFVSGATGPVVLAVRSVLAGDDQDAKIAAINSIVSSITSQPDDLAATNTLATAGGDSVESDESLRDRARRFFTTARKGTLSAIESAALNVPGIQTATAFEVLDVVGRPVRLIQLVVADAFTEQFVDFATVPPRFELQSQAITTAVSEALSDTRPFGTFVQIIVANTVIQPFQLVLSFVAGANVNDAALRARAAVVNFVNALQPGTPLVIQDLLDRIQLVPGLRFTGNEIISPAGNVITTPLQVLRTSLGLVSAVAAQTDQPIITGSNPDSFVLAGA